MTSRAVATRDAATPEVATVRRDRLGLLNLPVHPFLFASVAVLNLWAENLSDQVRFGDVLHVWAAVLLVVAAASGLVLAAVRRARLAAAITTVFVLWTLWFGYLEEPLRGAAGEELLVIAWIALGVGAVALTVTFRRWLSGITRYLNLVGGCLVLVNLVPVASHEIAAAAGGTYQPAGLESLAGTPSGIAANRPDIYYIILDRYPSQQTLAGTTYEYDNSPFLEELERRGFYVAPHSHANYTFTALSIASSLNMDYLDVDTMAEMAPTPDAWKPVYDMLAGSLAAPEFLERQGYTYVQLPSWFEPTATGSEVDIRPRLAAFSEIADALYRSTIFPIALERLGIRGPGTGHADHALFQFEQLVEPNEVAGPRFVFAHILLPHPPYVFGPDGVLPVSEVTDGNDAPREAFLGQLEYTNRRVLDVLDELLRDSDESDPVVIIQADEGPYNPLVVSDWRSASPEDYQLKFGILNAYYMPGITTTGLYPAITPVNTFRLLFNDYFGAEFPLLEDRVYAFGKRIYENVDITDRLMRMDEPEPIDAEGVVYEVAPPSEWTAGTSQAYEVSLRNTGTVTWQSRGPDAVALRVRFQRVGEGTDPTLDHAIRLERDVAPGQTARVRVDVAAPDADGVYRLDHRLAHGVRWFRSGPFGHVSVTSTYESWDEVLSATYRFRAPEQWAEGATATYSVRVTNDGAHTWSATGDRPVMLGIHFSGPSDIPHDGWVTDDRFFLPHDVAPGKSVVVDVDVTAPEAPGDYVLRHRLVKENTKWFADLSGVSVVVTEGSAPTWLIAGLAGVGVVSVTAGVVALLIGRGRGMSRRARLRALGRRLGRGGD